MTKQESKKETMFTVFSPPNIGFYKLEIYASKIPKNNGIVQLPLVGIILVEVRLQFSSDNSTVTLVSSDKVSSKNL